MVPNAILDRVNEVRNAVTGCRRISVTDLTRGKDWRSMLPEAGIMEMRGLIRSFNRMNQKISQLISADFFYARIVFYFG